MNSDMRHATKAATTWPKTFTAESAPVEVLALAALIVPRLLAGDDPTMAELREQYERAVIRRVELRGLDFVVDYQIRIDAPPARPRDLAGGDVKIPIAGFSVPDGSRLLVCNGRLASFEGTIPVTPMGVTPHGVRASGSRSYRRQQRSPGRSVRDGRVLTRREFPPTSR